MLLSWALLAKAEQYVSMDQYDKKNDDITWGGRKEGGRLQVLLQENIMLLNSELTKKNIQAKPR